MSIICLDLAGFDVFYFAITIGFLAHDLQIFTLVFWFWIKLKEILLQLFRSEFNENAAFEHLGIATAQPNCIGRSVRCEECFDIELCAWDFFSKALGIDAAWHSSILEDFDYLFDRSVIQAFRKWLDPLNAGVIISESENGRILHGRDNRFKGLEVAHAFKGVDDVEFNGMVFATTDFREEEFVHWKVRVGEVELDLEHQSLASFSDHNLTDSCCTCLRIATGSLLSS